MSLRVVFMGSPDFAVPALHSLIESPHEIAAVYTQPPRPKGRGHQLQKTAVHLLAEQHAIPVHHPPSLKPEQEKQAFKDLEADIAVVAAYGLILPKAILQAPHHGCVNIHASLLPRWRGASPIQHAIWKGDPESGVSLMQMEAGLDTGPVIAMEKTPITAKTTAQSLHDELARIGAEMTPQVLNKLEQGEDLIPAPQDDALATYAPLLTKEQGRIDWTQSAIEIDRQIRALNPWPGTWTEINGKRLKILEASLGQKSASEAPGTLIGREGHVACGSNTHLRLVKVQPEGAKAMDVAAAMNGNYLEINNTFE